MSEANHLHGTPVKSVVTTGATRDAALLSGPRKEEAKVSAVPPLLSKPAPWLDRFADEADGKAETSTIRHKDPAVEAPVIPGAPCETVLAAEGSALNGVGMIDGKPVRFRMPDYTNEDYGPEIC